MRVYMDGGMAMDDAERLKKLVRFEVDPALFNSALIADAHKFVGTYKPTYHDLVAAVKNMIVAGVDVEVFEKWYDYVAKELKDCYEGMFGSPVDYGYLWPANDYDQFKAMHVLMEEFYLYDEFCCSQKDFAEALQVFLRMADNYEYNRKHEPAQWKLTDSQRELILSTLCEDVIEISDSRRELLENIVDEACEDNDPRVMRIREYGC